MIKRILSAVVLAAALAGCAATGTVSTPTANDIAKPAIASVTAARKTSTALLLAHKITLEQDQAAQAKLDVVRASIEAARALADPAAQVAQLKAQQAAADKINTNLGGTAP